jgi:hypothetical protein
MIYRDIFLKGLYEENQNIYSKYYLENLLNNQYNKIEKSRADNRENIEKLTNILTNIDYDLYKLNNKLKDALDVLKKSIVGERNFIGYIYSTNIPLNKSFISDVTTATVQSNIVYGATIEKEIKELTYLTYKDISSETLNIVPNTHSLATLKDFNIYSKDNKQIHELSFNVEKFLKTSFILEFKDHQLIEILIDDTLTIEKSLRKSILLPINNKSLIVRIHSIKSTNQTVHIKKIGVSNKVYESTTVYESSPIQINKELEYINLEICDNTSKNVDIQYEIKINNGNYELFESNKNNLKTYQNVIKLNKSSTLETLEVEGLKENEDAYKFYIPVTGESNSYTVDVRLKNNLIKRNKELFIVALEDTNIVINNIKGNSMNRVFIDNKEITTQTEIIPKGIRSVVVLDGTGSNVIEITEDAYTYLNTIFKTIYISSLKKQVFKDSKGSFIVLTNTELKESFNLLSKDKFYAYFNSNKHTLRVQNIQVKATMKSLDKSTCPYISKIIVKGM